MIVVPLGVTELVTPSSPFTKTRPLTSLRKPTFCQPVPLGVVVPP
jgi:hypothetical protein